MPLTDQQADDVLNRLGALEQSFDMITINVTHLEADKRRFSALDTGTAARLDAIESTLERMVRDVLPRVDALERCDVVTDTAVGLISENHKRLEQLVSTLAADVSRVDNKTDPAAGTVAQRLEALELAKTTLAERAQEGLRAEQEFRDELAALRAKHRDLIVVLQAPWPTDSVMGRHLAALLGTTILEPIEIVSADRPE